jgi:hypothetical protein
MIRSRARPGVRVAVRVASGTEAEVRLRLGLVGSTTGGRSNTARITARRLQSARVVPLAWAEATDRTHGDLTRVGLLSVGGRQLLTFAGILEGEV